MDGDGTANVAVEGEFDVEARNLVVGGWRGAGGGGANAEGWTKNVKGNNKANNLEYYHLFVVALP